MGKKRLAHATWINDHTLHIETELGIVNIKVGYTDMTGQKVETIEVFADQYAGEPQCRVNGKDKAGYLQIVQDKPKEGKN